MNSPASESPSIRFLGGTGTVTGSKFLFEHNGERVLVDCGLFQGLKELRLLNREEFPVDPASIPSVILTHAHLDHSGYIPLLVKNGFSGKIYCTSPTQELAEILLFDSAKIQEEDAEYANMRGFSRHKPALPLYRSGDVERALKQFVPVSSLGVWIPLGNNLQVRFSRSGHILGSAFVELKYSDHGEERILAFSGDLGRSEPLLLDPPSRISSADFLVLESTYGDRNHPADSVEARLRRVVLDTIERGGHLIVPSFAVGRAQELIFLFSKLIREGKIPKIPIFLDSPMGVDVTRVFLDFPEWHRLNAKQSEKFCEFVTVVKKAEDSQRLFAPGTDVGASIVIAGSGMGTGGRVLHHLLQGLSDEKNTVLLVGYQAPGTRGRLLLDGAPEVKIHGQYIPVRARLEQVAGLSAHADQSEIFQWLSGFVKPPRKTFIVHGEKQASEALLLKIRDRLGWQCTVPRALDKAELLMSQ